MQTVSTTVACPLHDSFRVQQVAGLFDLPLAERLSETFVAELPSSDDAWTIGAIVGPSGSGKSTLARAAFGPAVYSPGEWPTDRAIVDCLGDDSIQRITRVLTAVGLGSPPAWVKPYHVLSGGERFRCDLARALLTVPSPGATAGSAQQSEPGTDAPPLDKPAVGPKERLVVFDEFTSVVDRTVARFASAAIARALRSDGSTRFVAVTCHYDVLEWLQPDWVLDLASGKLTWGCLRRPELRIVVRRCPQRTWRMFARHHYLSGALSRGATCYLALWEGRPVAFCAVVAMLGRSRYKRITRIVTLPDFQGLGIGTRLVERVCEHYQERGIRVGITATHPAILGYCRKSPRWRFVRMRKTGHLTRQRVGERQIRSSAGRSVVSFEYVGSHG